jgi:hypothetical protein
LIVGVSKSALSFSGSFTRIWIGDISISPDGWASRARTTERAHEH